jgi:hypothetical protein
MTMDPYRLPALEGESETMKVAKRAEHEMLDTFARILSAKEPAELEMLVPRLDRLAHERLLALRFEARRRMTTIAPLAFTVTADGQIVEVPRPEAAQGDEKDSGEK